MENFQGNHSRATKIKIPPGMKTKKLVIGGGRFHSSCLSSTSFDSENVDPSSPVLRYLCGGSPISGKLTPRGLRSPLSMVENLIERSPPAVYRTPVKAVEGEEVLVMDGVPLRRSSRFSSSESSGSSGKSLFKAEMFLSPEDSGKRGLTCQFAWGQEDDRPIRLGIKNRSNHQFITRSPNELFFPRPTTPPDETMSLCNNYPSVSSNNDLARLNHEKLKARRHQPPPPLPLPPPPPPVPVPAQVAPTPYDPPVPQKVTASYKEVLKYKTLSDWSPQDDGIAVSLPGFSSESPPSRKDVNKAIEKALVVGTKRKKRLSAFTKFCPK